MSTEELERKEKWDRRFLALAEHVAQWSKDPSTKAGAVIVDPDNRVVSLGYNGFPRGVRDLPERLEDRKLKYPLTVHCEKNAVIFAEKSVKGCRLYTWPFMSCTPCAAFMIQSGIIEAIAPFSDNPRWVDDFKQSRELFEEAGIKLALY